MAHWFDSRKQVASAVLLALHHQGLTPDTAAERAGVPVGAIGHLLAERAGRVSAETALRVVEALRPGIPAEMWPRVMVALGAAQDGPSGGETAGLAEDLRQACAMNERYRAAIADVEVEVRPSENRCPFCGWRSEHDEDCIWVEVKRG